jgi:IS5 family transposase
VLGADVIWEVRDFHLAAEERVVDVERMLRPPLEARLRGVSRRYSLDSAQQVDEAIQDELASGRWNDFGADLGLVTQVFIRIDLGQAAADHQAQMVAVEKASTVQEAKAIGHKPRIAANLDDAQKLISAGETVTTAANVNDVTQTLALVDGIPPVAGRPGRPCRRPEALLGDKGYDSNPNRDELRKRRILPVISRRGAPNVQGLGKLRYVVEQTFALLHHFKRLAVRWERRTELHDTFVSLACSLICWRRLKKAPSWSCYEFSGT